MLSLSKHEASVGEHGCAPASSCWNNCIALAQGESRDSERSCLP